MASQSAPAVGLDFGSSYSCVAVFHKERAEVIANDHGNRTMPSLVGFTSEEMCVGDSALAQAAKNVKNTVYDMKKLLGKAADDPTLIEAAKSWPFKIARKGKKAVVEVQYKGETRTFSPEELASFVIVKLKETAEAFLGRKVKQAVISVPAHYSEIQRTAMQEACGLAGIEVLRVLNEPSSAALAYGLDTLPAPDYPEPKKMILMFDLGGNTFDVTVVTADNGVLEVRASAGCDDLGGENFTHRLVEHCATTFKRKCKLDARESPRSMRQLHDACERAKRTLSTGTQVSIEVDSLYEGVDFQCSVSRAKFEDLCSDLFTRCLAPVEEVLARAGVTADQLDDVLLMGGGTRLPKLQKMLQDKLGGKELNRSINPEEVAACGAALQAAHMLAFGATAADATAQTQEVPAVALPLGLASGAGMAVVVDAHSALPATRTTTVTTHADNQTAVLLTVVEQAQDARAPPTVLAKFAVQGLAPAPAGTPQITVKFEVEEGRLHVSAHEPVSGKSGFVTVQQQKA